MSRQDELKWELFLDKKKKIFDSEYEKGNISLYDDDVIAKLRNYYHDCIPLSIFLLCSNLCSGNCYLCSFLLSLGFFEDEFEAVVASIDELKLNPKYIYEYGDTDLRFDEHCYIERKGKDGKVYVYDTTEKFVYEKSVYDKIQSPRVVKKFSKSDILEYLKELDIKTNILELDSKDLSNAFLAIQVFIRKDNSLYHEKLLQELELFSKKLEELDIEDYYHFKNIK